MNNNAVKLGLIGAGRWGKIFIKSIQNIPDITLSVVSSRNPDTKKLLAPSCAIVENWQQVFNYDIAGIIVASPPETHFAIVKEAITKNVPCLVEKPITLSLEEAKDLLEYSRQNSHRILVDHIHLFHPCYQKLKQLCYGKVDRIISVGGNYGPFRSYSALWDYAPHDIALCLDLLGSYPDKIEAQILQKDDQGANYRLSLAFGEVDVEITVGNIFAKKQRVYTIISGQKALVFDDLLEDRLQRYSLQDSNIDFVSGEVIAHDYRPPLDCVLENFCQGIQGKMDNRWGIELAVQVVEILHTCEQQLR